MKKNRGFTLVELSLSLAFISILSITIVIIINDMILSYQKGLVLKQVNTTGSALIDDFRSAIASSSTNNLKSLCSTVYSNSGSVQKCKNDNAYRFVYTAKTSDVEIGDKTYGDVPVYGAFCSGSYSYIWNSGYFFDSSTYKVKNASRATFSYSINSSSSKTTLSDFRLLKIPDPSRSICVNAQKSYYENSNSNLSNAFTTDEALSEDPVDLLANETNLALYDLYISNPAQDQQSQDAFYSGSFILATIQGGINIKASGNYCATPSEYKVENFDYCAINKFNFAKQANGA